MNLNIYIYALKSVIQGIVIAAKRLHIYISRMNFLFALLHIWET